MLNLFTGLTISGLPSTPAVDQSHGNNWNLKMKCKGDAEALYRPSP
jgi:hypothetical protein